MQDTYTAGDNIEARCTKCRRDLDHTIVAMSGARIAKVKCRTCGSTHNYRDPAAATKGRAASAGAPDSGTAAARWEKAVQEAGGRCLPYAMDGKFQVGDCILHDRFGKGVVVKLLEKKCEVLFRDGQRLMATGI